MIVKVGACRNPETGDFGIMLCQWINVPEKAEPTARCFLTGNQFPTKDQAEQHLQSKALPELEEKIKHLRESLPLLNFRSGVLTPEQMSNTRPIGAVHPKESV